MVFVRYVLGHNTICRPTSPLLPDRATFIGSPYVLLSRGHVNVDVLPHYLARGRASGWLSSRRCVVRLLRDDRVLTFLFWKEPGQPLVSDTCGGAAVDSYSSMPIGLASSRCSTSATSTT